jgi:hypothetical protein
MKKLLFTATLVAAAAYFNTAQAQISFSVNIGDQPSWGPTGYDHVEYYYIPDIQAYYYVPSHEFIYLNRGHWAFSHELPPRYYDFDLYHSRKIVMNEPQPYLHFNEHRAQYEQFRGDPHGQEFIHDSRDDKYKWHWHDQHEADEEWRHRPEGDKHWEEGRH